MSRFWICWWRFGEKSGFEPFPNNAYRGGFTKSHAQIPTLLLKVLCNGWNLRGLISPLLMADRSTDEIELACLLTYPFNIWHRRRRRRSYRRLQIPLSTQKATFIYSTQTVECRGVEGWSRGVKFVIYFLFRIGWVTMRLSRLSRRTWNMCLLADLNYPPPWYLTTASHLHSRALMLWSLLPEIETDRERYQAILLKAPKASVPSPIYGFSSESAN